MKIRMIALVSMMFVLGSLSLANAYTVGSGWQYFTFDDVGSIGAPTLDFTLSTAGQLKVTDAFLAGDQFTITNFGTTLGTTNFVAADATISMNNPDEAFSDPRWSHGIFDLAAGTYSISEITLLSPFGYGGAYWRVDESAPVPEPGTLLLLGIGMAGLGIYGSRRKNNKA